MDRCNVCKHQDSCVNVPYGCECFEIDLSKHDTKVRADAIKDYTTKLKSRLLDAITKEHLESTTNLINDVAEMGKEK